MNFDKNGRSRVPLFKKKTPRNNFFRPKNIFWVIIKLLNITYAQKSYKIEKNQNFFFRSLSHKSSTLFSFFGPIENQKVDLINSSLEKFKLKKWIVLQVRHTTTWKSSVTTTLLFRVAVINFEKLYGILGCHKILNQFVFCLNDTNSIQIKIECNDA